MEYQTTVDRVTMLIEAERAHQDDRWGGLAHDRGHTSQEWRDFIVTYTAKAFDLDPAAADYVVESDRRLIQVAALGVRVTQMMEYFADEWSVDMRMLEAANWGWEEFPMVSARYVAARIVDEAAELGEESESSPAAALEAADVAILLAIYCSKAGIDLAKAISEKMAINERRTWDHATMKHLKAPTP